MNTGSASASSGHDNAVAAAHAWWGEPPSTPPESEPEPEPDPAITARIPAPRTAPEASKTLPPLPPPSTSVIPYAVSSPSKRTRWLRGWMLVAPVDAAALAAPMLLTLQYWRGTLTMVVVTIAFFAFGGLYRARRYVSILDELPTICGRLLASSAVVAIIAAMRHDSVGYVEGFMRSVALSAALVIVGRTLTRTAIIVARRRRWVEHNAIIIGSGPIALELARLLRRHPQYGLRFAGCVDTVPAEGALVKPAVAALLGGLDSLDRSIELVDCDVLIVADSAGPDDAVLAVLGTPAGISRDVWIVPRLWGAGLEGDVPDHIGAIPLLHMRHNAFGGPRWAVKRGSDIALSATALILLSPILLLCAIAVWLEGRGRSGIFFKQERVGHYGRPFNVIKFRSMMPRDENDSQTTWSIAGDSRVGPIGRFLRRTSADELPQLWNILRGDMTVVGPRPERPYFVDRFSAEHPEYAMRHRVPVGLTGLAQVNGLRGDTPISDRARFDNFYIQHWSLWLDVKVILRTISEVLRGGGR